MSTLGATDDAPSAWVRPEQSVRRPRVVLVVLCTSQFVLAIDGSIVTVANATIERALRFTSANLQWTVTAYALTFGGFLLLGGRLADLYPRRRLFIVGVGGFAVASLGAGASQNLVQLIACRAAQGSFAALLSPTVLSLLSTTFAEGRLRQRALGIWASAGSLGAMVGFLLGGLITATLGWRWIFFINGPCALLAITAGVRWLPRASDERARHRLDLFGALSVTSGLALIIYGLGEAQSTSWTASSALVPLLVAPLLLGVFVLIERRTAEPLLPFRLLRRRAAVGNFLSILQQSVGSATLFLSPLYTQQVFGYSPLRAGAGTLPLPTGFALAARLGSRSIARLGARRLVVGGFLIVTAATLWLSRTPDHASYWTTFFPGLLARGFGQGLIVYSILVTVTSGVAPEGQGVAAGLYNMCQQMGGAIGLAIFATVAAAAASGVGVGPTAEAHGIQVAFFVSGGVALLGGAIASRLLSIADRDQHDADGRAGTST